MTTVAVSMMLACATVTNRFLLSVAYHSTSFFPAHKMLNAMDEPYRDVLLDVVIHGSRLQKGRRLWKVQAYF